MPSSVVYSWFLLSGFGLLSCTRPPVSAPTRSVVLEAVKQQPDAVAPEIPLEKREYGPGKTYAVSPPPPYAGPRKPLKNIILLIGDGMGPAQVTGGLIANRGQLYLQQAQATGLSITANQYGKITDSAASATAMATGHKTYNGAISMDSLGHSFRSIMWDARALGKSTGLVVACELPDATPACFAVNHTNRQDLEVIARKFLDAPIDFIYGGGLKFFAQRQDQVDLLAQWRAKGYQVATTPQQARALTSPKAVALLADAGPARMPARTAAYMELGFDKALELLGKNNKGFFLMVEGSQIDDAGHFNDTSYNVQEVLDFDQQVGKAFRFAAQNGETLVIVTADHETGGYSVVGGSSQTGKVEGRFTTTHHSAVVVPVFAYGNGSELFTGMYQNTEIYHRIKQAMVKVD